MTTLEPKSKRKTYGAIIGILIVFGLIVLLENLHKIIPGVPDILYPTSVLFTVLKKAAVYSLVAVSMNLLNGFTGLFSLGQAGFMLLGAYTYAILMVPGDSREQVYYLYGGSAIKQSIQDLLNSVFGKDGGGGAVSLILSVIIAILIAGCIAAVFAWLIGFPVLRLKSDYLAIATLGFAEILGAVFKWQKLGKITNGANMIKNFPNFSAFNIKNSQTGETMVYLSTLVPFIVATVCIIFIVLLVNSTYGRAFKAIRDDEIAAEAMGINLSKHKRLSFVVSSFFAGISGALFAMYVSNAQAKVFTTTLTYEILLIVVIGGIGSISGSIIATFLYVSCSEWWLRFLDEETFIGTTKVPLLKNGFRMVVFSVVIMIVVLFFRKGIMGTKEIGDLHPIKALKAKKAKKSAIKAKDGAK
ncbi:MAG: branched-chain amino acid ABC transporter permease [Clostridia bacterium]|nr:branched-chain amino acid ABC transporter permease [Clostridia bacterium]